MGYKFIKTIDPENRFDTVEIEMHMPDGGHSLSEMLEVMRDFLRACGFQCNDLEEAAESELLEQEID